MNALRIDMLVAVADRTGNVAFFLGNRLYGMAIAFATGPQADRYRFIRALAVTLLKAMVPELQPLLEAPRGGSTPLR